METVTETKQNFRSFVEMLNASMGWDNKVTIVGDCEYSWAVREGSALHDSR